MVKTLRGGGGNITGRKTKAQHWNHQCGKILKLGEFEKKKD